MAGLTRHLKIAAQGRNDATTEYSAKKEESVQLSVSKRIFF
jgi:hypothetical protein